MRLFTLRYILVAAVCAALFSHGFVSATAQTKRFTVRNGWKIFGGVVASFRAMSPIECLRSCLNSRQACNSVNFGPVSMGGKYVQCELVKTNQDTLINMTAVPGWSLVVGE